MTTEEMQNKIIELSKTIEQLSNNTENLQKEVELKNQRISSLEEHNQKLFLRVTTEVDNKNDEKDDEYNGTLIDKKTYDILSDECKEELIKLEESI
ncbi:MAG: hypothetical protein ACI3T9_06725 [Romboutsia timonensis]